MNFEENKSYINKSTKQRVIIIKINRVSGKLIFKTDSDTKFNMSCDAFEQQYEEIPVTYISPPLDEDTCLGCGKPVKNNKGVEINGDVFHTDCTPEGDPDYTKIINDIAEKLPVEDQICGVINPHKRDEVMSHNIGDSNYAKKRIQPWDIWEEYKLNAWDADIVKRVLRDKSSQSRRLDYEKIIHICQKRISQIDKGIKMYGEPESKVCENCCIVYNGNLNNCPKCGEANNE